MLYESSAQAQAQPSGPPVRRLAPRWVVASTLTTRGDAARAGQGRPERDGDAHDARGDACGEDEDVVALALRARATYRMRRLTADHSASTASGQATRRGK